VKALLVDNMARQIGVYLSKNRRTLKKSAYVCLSIDLSHDHINLDSAWIGFVVINLVEANPSIKRLIVEFSYFNKLKFLH